MGDTTIDCASELKASLENLTRATTALQQIPWFDYVNYNRTEKPASSAGTWGSNGFVLPKQDWRTAYVVLRPHSNLARASALPAALLDDSPFDTDTPTACPTAGPTDAPTSIPTSTPTSPPTAQAPTTVPTVMPTSSPTAVPTDAPTSIPTSLAPTAQPTNVHAPPQLVVTQDDVPVKDQGKSTNEDGQTRSIDISLTDPPGADVTVSVSSSDLSEVTVDPAQLLFTSENYVAYRDEFPCPNVTLTTLHNRPVWARR